MCLHCVGGVENKGNLKVHVEVECRRKRTTGRDMCAAWRQRPCAR